jgi:hypothetical protein
MRSMVEGASRHCERFSASGEGLFPSLSCPAKAGHPVTTKHRCLLDRPLARATTRNGFASPNREAAASPSARADEGRRHSEARGKRESEIHERARSRTFGSAIH